MTIGTLIHWFLVIEPRSKIGPLAPPGGPSSHPQKTKVKVKFQVVLYGVACPHHVYMGFLQVLSPKKHTVLGQPLL